jgi:tetratricopeptide (TPR) repeat protein
MATRRWISSRLSDGYDAAVRSPAAVPGLRHRAGAYGEAGLAADLRRCDDALMRSGRAQGVRPALRYIGRDRSQAWWLLVVPAVIAGLWAALQLVKASVPLPVQVLVAVVAAVIAVIVPELRARRRLADERRQVMATHLRLLTDAGKLPFVEEVDDPSQLGVTRLERHGDDAGERSPPYVRRARDAELDRMLATRRFVLLVGPSKAGKSRTAYEAMRRNFPERALLVPASKASLPALLALGLVAEDAVIWLDDLENYLGSDGLTEHVLHRLTGDPSRAATVLATMRAGGLDRFGPRLGDDRREFKDPSSKVLERAQPVVRLDRKLDRAERARAREQLGNRWGAVLERYGLGEYLVAGPALIERFENNLSTQPVGIAVVRAAVDWRRMGLTRPVPLEVLERLYPSYLEPEDQRPEHVNSDAFERGLQWASEPVYGTSSLVLRSGDTVLVFDYVLDYVERERRPPIPDAAWAQGVQAVADDPAEGLDFGLAAFDDGALWAAVQAWRAVAASDSPLAHRAARCLGWALHEQRDITGAEAAYNQAIDSGDPDEAPAAMIDYGVLRWSIDDLAGAQAAFEQAIAADHPDLVPLASVNLARVLARQGDAAKGQAILRRVAASGHPDQAPRALRSLGYLLEDSGDVAGARAAFEQVIASSHPIQAPKAMVALGDLLADSGDPAGARAAYEQAIGSSDPELSTAAGLYLAVLLAKQGDFADARDALDRLIDAAGPDGAAVAASHFGLTYLHYGPPRARFVAEQVIASSHPELAPVAMVFLGNLLAEQGDLAGARAAYEQAVASRHPEMRRAAAEAFDHLGTRDPQLGTRNQYYGTPPGRRREESRRPPQRSLRTPGPGD